MARRATTRKRKQPAKFDRCVRKVRAKGGAKNAYAVCTAAGTRNLAGNLWTAATRDLAQSERSQMQADGYIVSKLKRVEGGRWGFRYSDPKGRSIPQFYTKTPKGKEREPSTPYYPGPRNPVAASAEVFEEFHGYPPTEVVKVTQEVHHHTHLAAAGDLVGLEVKPVDHGAVRRIEGLGDAILAFNEAKNQLFIRGGDQKMGPKELAKFGIEDEHELQTLGKLVAIGYFANKTHLGSEGGEAVYSHTFRTTNENGTHVTVKIARYPDLIYRVLDEQLEISGGSYEIRREGIDK
jgi:hypothetical protein